jgi:hypothetical protein
MVSNNGSADENDNKANQKKAKSERVFQRKNLFKSVKSPANTQIQFDQLTLRPSHQLTPK